MKPVKKKRVGATMTDTLQNRIDDQVGRILLNFHLKARESDTHPYSQDIKDEAILALTQVVKNEVLRIGLEVIGEPIEYKKLSQCPICSDYMYSCTCATAQEALVNKQRKQLERLVEGV